jgi:hypothetical protein
MCVLIGNMVKTRTADYPCKTREEAEALYMALRDRHPARTEPQEQPERTQEREKAEV